MNAFSELLQLVYVSQRTDQFNLWDVPSLVSASCINNARLGVSGVLLCLGDHILQLLEGEPLKVAALFDHIEKDPRHGNVLILLRKTVNRRMFPEWGMALADFDCNSKLNRERLVAMINHVRENTPTAGHSVEARILLNDFKQQLLNAA